MKALASVAVLLLVAASGARAGEAEGVDLAQLNASIGLDYEAAVELEDVIGEALQQRLVLYGEVHDQLEAVRNFLQFVDAMRRRSPAPMRIGVEFVDRGDWDILVRYLQRSLSEEEFLARLMPTSLLLYPELGPAHLDVLRYARRHAIDVLPLESRPAGARSMVLRNSEIRWNLATQLGRHATERLVVLYGVQHLFGPDAVSEGLDVTSLTVASYGDSVLHAYDRREGHFPEPGRLLRVHPGSYVQAVGGPPREAKPLALHFGAREPLLLAIEETYSGNWRGLGLLVEALVDPEIRWRRAAFDALRYAAERSFGYDPEADAVARAEAQQRWSAWVQRNQKRLVGVR